MLVLLSKNERLFLHGIGSEFSGVGLYIWIDPVRSLFSNFLVIVGGRDGVWGRFDSNLQLKNLELDLKFVGILSNKILYVELPKRTL